MLSAYDGVAHSTAPPKSRSSMTWRCVKPPEIGTTVQPISSAPW